MSLQDQLMKAGLVDKNKAKDLRAQKRKQTKVARKSKETLENEAAADAKIRREEQARHDRELNRQRQLMSEKKAVQAQIKQLIELNRQDRAKAQVKYHFMHLDTARSIYVTTEQQKRIASGQYSIVEYARENDQLLYEVVPSPVADKIIQRDSARVVLIENKTAIEEDDYYADYQIPDDLMW